VNPIASADGDRVPRMQERWRWSNRRRASSLLIGYSHALSRQNVEMIAIEPSAGAHQKYCSLSL
jgi:hypothetical protein